MNEGSHIYVVDQNYFRAEDLKKIVSAVPQAKFVIPDIALLEMCKGPNWEGVMRKSLSTLSTCSDRVFLSMSVFNAINFEVANLKSVEGRLLPKELRKLIRSILFDIQNGTSSYGVSTIISGIKNAQVDIGHNELNHAQNELSLRTRTKIIYSLLDESLLKRLKKGAVSDPERLSLIKKISTELFFHYLSKSGVSENKIRIFLKTKPLLLRHFHLCVRHAFEWTIHGGINSFPAEKMTNDILDQDYVAIASFFDELLSKDSKVLKADKDLRQLLMMDS